MLHRRLLYAAVLSGGAFTLYTLTLVVEWATNRAAVSNRGTSLVLSASFTALLVAAAIALARFKSLPIAFMRVIELAGVGCLLVWDVRTTLNDMSRATPELVRAGMTYASSDIFPWFMHICVYAGLIPDSARRAAQVVGGMALIGAGTMIFAWSQLELLPGQLFGWVCNLVMYLGVAMGFAVFNSARLDSYRRAVLAAREIGQYRLGRKLGSGGMGEVFLATHRLMKRPCAVKLIRPERLQDPSFATRFEREVAATARLNHPSAVQVYDYGQTADGTFYYVMEWLPGLTLDEVVRRTGPLPPARAVHILRQVCGAMRTAHLLGLVHRDVKPGNIMVCRFEDRFDVAKLLDFGLVAEVGPEEEDTRLTQVGQMLGTPAYMSPEQARGESGIGPSSDLYSLGAVGYFLVTGGPPFAGKSGLEVLHAHTSAAVRPPSQVQPGVPADVEAVILRLLSKDPKARFADAAAVESALAACECAGGWLEADSRAWWSGQSVEFEINDGAGAAGMDEGTATQTVLASALEP